MDPSLEEVKARLLSALWLEDADDWLERAEDACLCMVAMSRNATMPRPVDLETFGGRITWAREVTGMGIRELGRRIGLAPMHMNDVEKGRRDFPAEKLPGLSMSLGVSRAWLLGDSVDGGPPYPHAILRSIRSEAYYRYWAKRNKGGKRWKQQRAHAQKVQHGVTSGATGAAGHDP